VPTPTVSATATATTGLVNGCAAAPVLGCSRSGKAVFSLKRGSDPSRNQFSFQWLRGSEAPTADFGDPTLSSDYSLCIYDSAARRMALNVPAAATCVDRPCWSLLGRPDDVKGYRYRDRNLVHDGVQAVLLKSGTDQRAKIALKGKGSGLVVPAPGSFAPKLTVQLIRSGECWEAEFDQIAVSSAGDRLKSRVTVPAAVGNIGVSNDGGTLYVPGCGRACTRRVAMPSGVTQASDNIASTVRAIDLSADGNRVVVATNSTVVRVLDASLVFQRLFVIPSIPAAVDLAPDSLAFRSLQPAPKQVLDKVDISNGIAGGSVVLPLATFDLAHMSSCSNCVVVSLPTIGLLQIVRNGATAELINVGASPRYVATSRPSSGTEYIVTTSRALDSVTIANATTLLSVASTPLHNPVNLDASPTHAFVLYENGARIAVISLTAGPTFAQVLASVSFPQRLDAVRVARGTGIAHALAGTHDKVWTVNPATLPVDGSVVAAGVPVSIGN
jgi:hypothetical protein